ncbi:glycoside hydrolase family 140 protein [Pseudonocardia endophytica]|uniref:Collagenase-like protein with putative collagen-binding domain n=1 Tax=Pseudonocardia endophytica TaxID=401976 RepID=A0A4R1HQJ5_PSEEN|nr:glycoside hydrolase family 140 protein [Pseudonocardia endophytica]TCK24837.1 collagenase-like protein with putative collagen-binding domain [Pseudonocardia endophytica]
MNRVLRRLAVGFACAAVLGSCAAGTAPPPGPDTQAPGPSSTLEPLKADGRFLSTVSGTPFFWLGDTAWALPSALDREETARYLDVREEQGYTVIQVVAVFPHVDGKGANAYGDEPLTNGLNPATTPGADPDDEQAYDWWDNLDSVVDAAAARGIRVALLPVWADQQIGSLLTERNARTYGEFVGNRYGDRVVWVLGGDEGADGSEDVWTRLAEGIEAGAGRDVLMTYHPIGDASSAQWFSGEKWLDMNMIQGGHCLRYDVRARLVADSGRAGLPWLDGEPIYEDHPYCWDRPPEGYASDLDVRRDAYWAVFGGALGHTYGHHAVWQFQTPGGGAALDARPGADWRQAIQAPGGVQMGHLRALMESRPYTTGRAAPQVVSDAGSGADRIQATRATDGSYLMAYVPNGREFEVDLGALPGPARTWWFDPRTGEVTEARTTGGGRQAVTPPDGGEDWVFVADDAARNFPAPGSD